MDFVELGADCDLDSGTDEEAGRMVGQWVMGGRKLGVGRGLT